jgi:hypothetical protein
MKQKCRRWDEEISTPHRQKFTTVTEYLHNTTFGEGVPTDGGPSFGLGWKLVGTDTYEIQPLPEKEPKRPRDDGESSDEDDDSDDEDGKAEKMRKSVRIQILKSSGHRRASIDLSSLLMKGVQTKRVESAFSKAARKVMDGEDPVEVEKWERRALAEEKIQDWFRASALKKMRETIRARKDAAQKSNCSSLSADMLLPSEFANDISQPSFASAKARSDLHANPEDTVPYHEKKHSGSINVGAMSSAQWADFKQSATSRQPGYGGDQMVGGFHSSSSSMQQRRVSVAMPIKGDAGSRDVKLESKPSPSLDARQINALLSYGNVQNNRRKSSAVGSGRKRSIAKKDAVSISAGASALLMTMPRLDSVSKMMLDSSEPQDSEAHEE